MNELTKDQDLKIIGKQIAESIPSLEELSLGKSLREVIDNLASKKTTSFLRLPRKE